MIGLKSCADAGATSGCAADKNQSNETVNLFEKFFVRSIAGTESRARIQTFCSYGRTNAKTSSELLIPKTPAPDPTETLLRLPERGRFDPVAELMV